MTELANVEITQALKLALKAKGVTYGQLANHLGVSEQTIKRLFKDKDCTLTRLNQICNFLAVSVYDLLEFSKDYKEPLTRLSAEQEGFLKDHPSHFSFLFFLCAQYSLEQIQQRYQLTDVCIFRYLRDLDKHGFLELSANNHFRLRIEGTILMRLDGPLANIVRERNQLFLEHTIRHNQKKGYGFESSFRFMSEDTLAAMRRDFEALTLQYRKAAWQDNTILPKERLIAVKWSVLMAPFDVCGVWPLDRDLT